MTAPLSLRPGLTQRALALTDATAVATLVADQELHDTGHGAVEEAELVSDWQRPSFDIAASTIGVFDSARLVAYGEVTNEVRGDAAVHPEVRRQGLGTAIATWMQVTARQRGMRELETQVLRGTPSDALLAKLGYVDAWRAWELTLPAGTSIPAAEPPPGFTIRAAEPAEFRACCTLQDEAFREWSRRGS